MAASEDLLVVGFLRQWEEVIDRVFGDRETFEACFPGRDGHEEWLFEVLNVGFGFDPDACPASVWGVGMDDDAGTVNADLLTVG